MGTVFASLRISPDRLGGGGDGGFEPFARGDRGGTNTGVGVRGRLGILKLCLCAPAGDDPATASGFKYGEWSREGRTAECFFGGDCGGCTVKDGG